VSPGRRVGGHRPDWGSTFIQLPWSLFFYYGDISLPDEHWPGMILFMEHLARLAKENIIYEGYGDMFAPGRIWSPKIQVALTSTALYYHNAKTMYVMATALEKSDEAGNYKQLASVIKKAFIKKFFNSKEKTFGSQTANAMALSYGLIPEGQEAAVAKKLANDVIEKHNGHFDTGHLGSRHLYSVLAEYDYDSVVKTILNQTTYPSIGELLSRGATTFWESWGEKEIDENSLGVRSRNHPFQAGYAEWFYSGIGGIKPHPMQPGFRKIILKPELVGELQYAKAEYQSVYGKIISDWEIKGGNFIWNVSIPVNTTAEIYFPTSNVNAVFESDNPLTQVEGIRIVEKENGIIAVNSGSGNYRFVVKLY